MREHVLAHYDEEQARLAEVLGEAGDDGRIEAAVFAQRSVRRRDQAQGRTLGHGQRSA